MTRRSDSRSLYIHVPFCASVCYYCDFCRTLYREVMAETWLDALEKELNLRSISTRMKTIYIGGGTPTSLNAAQLNRLLSLLDPYASEVEEYTSEVNPETMDEEKADILAAHGVNRISIGYQSDNAQMLKMMNRHHTAEDVRHVMDLLGKKGIDNISLDLMYSLPGQTMEMLQKAVHTAISMNPSHLSLYSLTVEENTVFGRKKMQPLDEETEADMYEWICQTLPTYGYTQYEISNFAREGKQSQHNLAYWTYSDFTGISCGASGKENHIRYDNTKSLAEYLENPLAKEKTTLSREDEMFEAVMMNLRLKEGISLSRFEETFHESLTDHFSLKVQKLIKDGLLETCKDRLRCTERGYHILNEVLTELL